MPKNTTRCRSSSNRCPVHTRVFLTETRVAAGRTRVFSSTRYARRARFNECNDVECRYAISGTLKLIADQAIDENSLHAFDESHANQLGGPRTHIDLYIFSPLGPTFWFCRRVLTRSSGNTHVTPMMPAMPPLITFGSRLRKCMRRGVYRINRYARDNDLLIFWCIGANVCGVN